MISIDTIESIHLSSTWMLEPRISELVIELRKRGYLTARVRPKSLGGYEITFIEPNVIARKGSTCVLYNFGRRTIAIEGPDARELLHVFNEVEELLKNVGSDPAKGVLFYELQAKARASGGRLVLKEKIDVRELLETELLVIPMSFVSAVGDPNTTQWFHLDVRPLWTSWSGEKVHYEVVLIYRDKKEKLLRTLSMIENFVKEIVKRICETLYGESQSG